MFLNTVIELVESIPDETELGIKESGLTLETWLAMIQNSHISIDIETFYLIGKEGEAIELVFNAIREAAARDVAVRIITDAKMAETYPDTLNILSGLEGVEVRRLSYFNKMGGVLHAKYFIVDGEEIFMGSQNLDWRAISNIHELGVHVKSRELAAEFLRIFELDWRIAENEDSLSVLQTAVRSRASKAQTAGGPIILRNSGETVNLFPVFSPAGAVLPGMENEEEALIGLINTARSKIEIQLLNYSPAAEENYYGVIDNALRSAAVRGVQVRMIVSNWNIREPDIYYLKSLQIIPGVEIGISTIPEHSRGFIPFARVEHCKYMVVDDDTSWIGTGNWSKEYFNSSRNIALVIKDGTINTLADKIFNRSWNSPYIETIDPCKDYEPPPIAGDGDF